MKQLLLFLSLFAICHPNLAEIIRPTKKSRPIPGEYIVQLNKGENVRNFIRTKSLQSKSGDVVALQQNVMRVYKRLINGFSVHLSDEQVLELNSMPEVKRISFNGYTTMARYVYDQDVAWQLGRLANYDTIPSTGPWFYAYDSSAGEDVSIYVLDTGINEGHVEFDDGLDRVYKYLSVDGFDNSNNPDNHGTAVASLCAGQWNGVARKAFLYDVKIANSSGTVEYDDVLAGMEVAAGDYWDWYNFEPVIVLLAINTYDWYPAIDDAIREMYEQSCIVVIVPAGNDFPGGTYSCDQSPAKSDYAMTIGASNLYDYRWSNSNYGKCVDFYAAGQDVTIASDECVTTNCTTTDSGTSYSAAIVAGLAAYFIRLFDLCICDDVWNAMYYWSNYESLSMPEYPMNGAGLVLNDYAWPLRNRDLTKTLMHSLPKFNLTNLTAHDKKKWKLEFRRWVRQQPELLKRLPSSKFD